MVIDQDNKCAICGKPETSTYMGKITSLCVDHDHKTGKTRKLLCNRCNVSLGIIENESFMKKAINYLSKYQ